MYYQLIDLSWTMYRSYYTLGHLTIEKNGMTKPTGHIFGALTDVERALRRGYKVILCLDGAPQGKLLNSSYKAGRQKLSYNIMQDRDTIISLALMHPLVRAAHNPSLEADEIMAELSRRYSSKGDKVEILSGDDDLLQTLSDSVRIRRGPTDKDVITVKSYMESEHFIKKYHKVAPKDLPKYRAIVGDKSDNLRGIERIPRELVVYLISRVSLTDPDLLRSQLGTLSFKPSQLKYVQSLYDDAETICTNYRIMNLSKHYTVYSYKPEEKVSPDEYKLTRWSNFLKEG